MKTCVIPNFLPKIALDIIAPPYSFISIDTPAGKSKRVIASTVFEFGSRISIKRLCVHFELFTRIFVYVYRTKNCEDILSVGNGIGPETIAPFLLRCLRS